MGAEGAGEGDGGEEDAASEALAADVFGYGHLGELVFAGMFGDEGAAADGAGAGEGHQDVAAGVEDAFLWIAEVEVVALFHAEVAGDPLLVEGEEGVGVDGLKGADLEVGWGGGSFGKSGFGLRHGSLLRSMVRETVRDVQYLVRSD